MIEQIGGFNVDFHLDFDIAGQPIVSILRIEGPHWENGCTIRANNWEIARVVNGLNTIVTNRVILSDQDFFAATRRMCTLRVSKEDVQAAIDEVNEVIVASSK
jgi:hypothetical protein